MAHIGGRRRRVGAAAVVALVLSGCGGGGDEDAPTPDEAFASLRDVSAKVLTEVAPEAEQTDKGLLDRAVPCGGLGGNEWNKVHYSHGLTAGRVTDVDATLARAEAALEALGLETDGAAPGPLGTSLSFRGRGFQGSVMVDMDGELSTGGATDCLDNPDR